MPGLDVSEVLRDPDLCDRFNVKRRLQSVASGTGRSSSTDTVSPSFGVVCMASGNQLDRLDDADRMGRNISVVTRFQLIGPAKDGAGNVYKPDVVVWRGDEYVVKYVDPYPQYGRGFVQAVCGAVGIVNLVT